jgi:hypothetical protein
MTGSDTAGHGLDGTKIVITHKADRLARSDFDIVFIDTPGTREEMKDGQILEEIANLIGM